MRSRVGRSAENQPSAPPGPLLWHGVPMKLLAAIVGVALVLAGCGSSSTAEFKACGRALDDYHAALVDSDLDGYGPDLDSGTEDAHQYDVVSHCSQSEFEALLSGDGYDYTAGPDAIALGDPDAVYQAFCSGAREPNRC